MKSHLFILSFMSFALGDILVKILLCGISEIFLPMLLSRTFMVSKLIFKSYIHPEFILVYGVSCWSSFIFVHIPDQISQQHLLKRLFVLHCILLPLCRILTDHGDMGFTCHSSSDRPCWWCWAGSFSSTRGILLITSTIMFS